jgi:cation transport ATPase
MAETTLTIKGMFCAGCAHTAQDALRSVPGVERATVDLGGGTAEVVYNPDQADILRMMGAVAAAGYEAAPRDEIADHAATPTIEEMLKERSLRIPILAGIAGALVLLAVYLLILSIAQSQGHALEQFSQDAWFVGLITAGFGIQVGLFVHLRASIQRGTSTAVPVGSGVTSTAAMAACCAHHLADVLPFLGLTAAAVFLDQYRDWIMLAALLMTAIGIGYMAYTVRKVSTGSCAPASADSLA